VLGTYDGQLSKMMSQLTGVFDEPEISWHRLQLSPDGSISKQPIIAPATDDDSLLKRLASPKNVWRHLRLARTQPNTHSTEHQVDPIWRLINDFIDAILDDREPVVSGESTLPAVELMNALMLSAIRKKTVDLPIDQDEYDELFKELSTGQTQVPRFR
jgi:hypothetical protein